MAHLARYTLLHAVKHPFGRRTASKPASFFLLPNHRASLKHRLKLTTHVYHRPKHWPKRTAAKKHTDKKEKRQYKEIKAHVDSSHHKHRKRIPGTILPRLRKTGEEKKKKKNGKETANRQSFQARERTHKTMQIRLRAQCERESRYNASTSSPPSLKIQSESDASAGRVIKARRISQFPIRAASPILPIPCSEPRSEHPQTLPQNLGLPNSISLRQGPPHFSHRKATANATPLGAVVSVLSLS